MELIIYNQSGNPKLTISPDDTATHDKEIMNDSVVSLSFKLYEYIPLQINDYIIFEGERFTMLEYYIPELISTVEYSYQCKFHGIESELKKAKVLNMVDGENEMSFSFDGTATQHLKIICDNINRIKGGHDWQPGEKVESGKKNIEYNNMFCFDALSEIAKAFETEWWIEGSTINLSRCEHGNAIALGYNEGLQQITRTENNTAKFFTRLYPLGSTRNIDPQEYKHKRLQLPDGNKYVDSNIDLGIVEQSEEEAFADIYPRRIGEVSSVRSAIAKDQDGKDYTIYYFKDNELPFDPTQYIIGAEKMRLLFQSGELNERDFDVDYNPKTKEFEIVTQFPYENQQLPNDILIPKYQDKYILYNINMPTEYYNTAEQEFQAAVAAYLEKISKDTSIYKAPTDYIYLDENNIKLTVGQRILLKSNIYFPDRGSRESRITKITRKIKNPSQADIECTYSVDFGKIAKLENDIVSLDAAFNERLNQEALQVLKSWDHADPSEYNVLSALRTIKIISRLDDRFISKISDDEVQGVITFLKGLRSKEVAIFEKGINDGKPISSDTGWNISYDADHNSVLMIDKLLVRMEARFRELVVEKLTHTGGGRIVSPASMICNKVDEMDSCYRCYFDTGDNGEVVNNFEIDDQVRCQVFTGAGLKFYWRLVTAVGDNYIDLSKSDANGEGIPAEGDNIVQCGNRSNVGRQNVIIETSFGTVAYIQYAKVNSFTLAGKEVTVLSPAGNIFRGNLIIDSLGTSIEDELAKRNKYTLILSNENASVACGSNGNPLGALPTCNIAIYEGTNEVHDWSITLTNNGCTSNLSNGTITISAINQAQASITVTASKGGETSLVKVITLTKICNGDKGDQGLQGLQGLQGAKGDQGIAGAKGADGVSTYFHIKYSAFETPTDSQITEIPSEFIGTCVDSNSEDPKTARSYQWTRFKGIQGDRGENGIPGVNGSNGETSYLHIKYSNDNGANFTGNNGELPGSYIGQYTDFNVADSSTASSYTWSKIKGDKGQDPVVYSLEPSVNAVKRSMTGVLTPATLSCKAWKTIGNEGRELVTGGVTICYRTSLMSNHAVYSAPLTLTAQVEWVDFELLDDNANPLDCQRVTVLSDASDLVVGGRNLLKESGVPITNSSYRIQDYLYGDIKPVKGKTYTISMKAMLGAGKLSFALYNSGITNEIYIFKSSDKGTDGVYRATFTWPLTDNSLNTFAQIYHKDSTTVATSTIEWIKLEEGNVATAWTPAPEDIQEDMDIAKSAIDAINDDSILDIAEKYRLRTTWELIHGADNLNEATGRGSYARLMELSSNVPTTALTASYEKLRTNFRDAELYEEFNTDGFNRSILVVNLSNYYAQETALLKAINEASSTRKVENLRSETTSTFEVKDKDIKARVTQIDYDNNKEIVSKRMSTIEQTATSISLKVCEAIYENLLLQSDIPVTNSDYPTAFYYYGKTKPTKGKRYNIAMKATLGEGKVCFGIYNSGGSVNVVDLLPSDKDDDGVFRKDFIWTWDDNSIKPYLVVYPIDSKVTAVSTIEWIKLIEIDESNLKSQVAKEAANNAQSAINAMNNDKIFDIVEKQTIRTQWEQISDKNDTTHFASNAGDKGSYNKAINAANQKISTTDLTTYYNNLKSNLNTNELYTSFNKAEFNRTEMANCFAMYYNEEVSIWDKISKAYADDINIGGVNLINYNSTTKNNAWSGTDSIVTVFDDGIIRGKSNTTYNGYPRILNHIGAYTSGFNLKIEYTLSFYVRASSSEEKLIIIADESGANAILSQNIAFTENWEQHILTFTPLKQINSLTTLQIYCGSRYAPDTTSWVELKDVKLEKGNRATSWTQSISDINGMITTAQSVADNANNAIGAMNDDNVFDIVEKQTIRIEWEKICGGRFDTNAGYPTGGSYGRAIAVAGSKINTNLLQTTFVNLRRELVSSSKLNLYGDINTPNFNRAKLAILLSDYYAKEIAIYDGIAKSYNSSPNILYNTNKGLTLWSKTSKAESATVLEAVPNDPEAVRFRAISNIEADGWCVLLFNGLDVSQLYPDTEYSISFKAKSFSNILLKIALCSGGGAHRLTYGGATSIGSMTDYGDMWIDYAITFKTFPKENVKEHESFDKNLQRAKDDGAKIQVYITGDEFLFAGFLLDLKDIMLTQGGYPQLYRPSTEDKLLDSGIDIEQKQITLTSDKVIFRSNDGDTVAKFTDTGIFWYQDAILVSALNAFGNGTMSYFYPPNDNGVSKLMHTTEFVKNAQGNVVGKVEINYNQDGTERYRVTDKGVIVGNYAGIDTWEHQWKVIVTNGSETKAREKLKEINRDYYNKHLPNSILNDLAIFHFNPKSGSLLETFDNCVFHGNGIDDLDDPDTTKLFTGYILVEWWWYLLEPVTERKIWNVQRSMDKYINGKKDDSGTLYL